MENSDKQIEDKAKIRKYGKSENRFTALYVAGLVSVAALMTYDTLPTLNKPEIFETYNNAQIVIKELRTKRKSLSDKLESYSYTTPEIEEAKELFNKEYNEEIFKLDRAVESAETDILNMKSDNPELNQYLQDKKAKSRNILYPFFGGGLATIVGVIGGAVFYKKKQDLEELKERKCRMDEWDAFQKS